MSMPNRTVSALPAGTAFSRYIVCLAAGRGDHTATMMLAEGLGSTPQVAASLALAGKAAVPAGSTVDATWAGPLGPYGVGAEALAILRGRSILGALQAKGRTVPLHTKLARETGTGFTGGWLSPGAPTPVQKTDFATIIQEHYKFGCITVLSRELLRLSDPVAEATIRTAVLDGLGAALDQQLLVPSVAAVAGLNPASITNGAPETTSTGTTAAAIAADLAAMLGSIATNGDLVWVMRPKTLYRIANVLGTAATGLPATLYGIPVITSANSPSQIVLADASSLLFSDTGQFDVSTSEDAALVMDQAPANVTQVVGASPIHSSLWQLNLFAVKAVRWVAWLRPTTSSVSVMTVGF